MFPEEPEPEKPSRLRFVLSYLWARIMLVLMIMGLGRTEKQLTKKESKLNLKDLPIEIFLSIADNLDPYDRGILAMTCKTTGSRLFLNRYLDARLRYELTDGYEREQLEELADFEGNVPTPLDYMASVALSFARRTKDTALVDYKRRMGPSLVKPAVPTPKDGKLCKKCDRLRPVTPEYWLKTDLFFKYKGTSRMANGWRNGRTCPCPKHFELMLQDFKYYAEGWIKYYDVCPTCEVKTSLEKRCIGY